LDFSTSPLLRAGQLSLMTETLRGMLVLGLQIDHILSKYGCISNAHAAKIPNSRPFEKSFI